MKAVTKIAKRLKDSSIDSESAAIFKELIQALDGKREFQLANFYNLNYHDFELALSLLIDWRLQQYSMTEGGLVGLMQKARGDQNATEINA